jgi:hypothetical protein
MDIQDTLDKVIEPELKSMFDTLNYQLFNDELTCPPSLRWYFGPRKKAGGFLEFGNSGTVFGMTVRGSLRGNRYAVKRVLIHEMTHLYLVQRFIQSGLDPQKWQIIDFVGDKSGNFILELAHRCKLAQIPVDEVSKWYSADESETSLTDAKYAQINDAKALLRSLTSDN